MNKELATISSDVGYITKSIQEQVIQIARTENIPITGITILGGKPYVNVTGLDRKIENKCEKEHIIFKDALIVETKYEATPESLKAGYKYAIIFFDQKGFQKALETITKTAAITKEIIDTLTATFTRRYEDVGFASESSLKMSTMKNPDNINMMASRRASNRAKRAATGCGLTSIDEVIGILGTERETIQPPLPNNSTDKETIAKEMRLSIVKEIIALYKMQNIIGKEQILEAVSKVIGREITSLKDDASDEELEKIKASLKKPHEDCSENPMNCQYSSFDEDKTAWCSVNEKRCFFPAIEEKTEKKEF